MQDKISARRLQRIIEIIHKYDCSKPLSLFLKEYFRNRPEMGSTDRRVVSSGIYNYYRLGKALGLIPVEEKIGIANFLFQSSDSPFLQYLLINHSVFSHEEITLSTERKLEKVQKKYPELTWENIFPFKEHLSKDIDFEKFVKGLLIQPKVWIRVRNNRLNAIINELNEKKIHFEHAGIIPNALSFENNIKLTELNSFKKGYYEIQDLSSQKTGDYMNAKVGGDWWDCCAGAGGKSLMLKDEFPEVNLFATDIRPSILQNLELRFQKAGLKNYSTKVIDLEREDLDSGYLFDGIICDVPCSGSGTWGRTPENISCFDESKILLYQKKQKIIALKASSHLKKNGNLIYITCSVFKEENEEVVEHILKNTKLKLQEMKLIDGTAQRADSLFVAVFKTTMGD